MTCIFLCFYNVSCKKDDRTKAVAQRVMEYLRKTDVYAKTIIFCVDTEHAERMRQAISNEAMDLVAENYKYVMRITGEDTPFLA